MRRPREPGREAPERILRAERLKPGHGHRDVELAALLEKYEKACTKVRLFAGSTQPIRARSGHDVRRNGIPAGPGP